MVRNEGELPIALERVRSAQWHSAGWGTHYLTHLSGRWAHEFQLRRERLAEGVKVV